MRLRWLSHTTKQPSAHLSDQSMLSQKARYHFKRLLLFPMRAQSIEAGEGHSESGADSAAFS
jgi:hypothetical protein